MKFHCFTHFFFLNLLNFLFIRKKTTRSVLIVSTLWARWNVFYGYAGHILKIMLHSWILFFESINVLYLKITNSSCTPNPCQHNGTLAIGSKQIECICQAPWDGRHCERLTCWRMAPKGFNIILKNHLIKDEFVFHFNENLGAENLF